MSLSPDKVGPVFDLFGGTSSSVAGTGAGQAIGLPPGRKAIQVALGTGVTATLKVQNSVDGTTWFDVTTNSTANSGNIYETDSCVPRWRVNVTAFTTAVAGSLSAVISQACP